ncbi:MAG: hypothetical protein QGD96_01670 [Anaerolineae bacterium]|nr:hypothetical protein [Anaerolineae bacterium]
MTNNKSTLIIKFGGTSVGSLSAIMTAKRNSGMLATAELVAVWYPFDSRTKR